MVVLSAPLEMSLAIISLETEANLPVLQALEHKELQAPKVPLAQAHKVLQELKVLQEHKVQLAQELKVPQEQVHKVLQAHKAQPEPKAQKVPKAQKELKARLASERKEL